MSFLRQLLIPTGLSVVAALATWAMHPRMHSYSEGRLEEGAVLLSALPEDENALIWVDARTVDEFQTAHIPGAIPLNEDNWEEQLVNLLLVWEPGKPVVVYCDSGGCHSSKAVAQKLRSELQSEEVYHLQGGWEAWLEAQNQ